MNSELRLSFTKDTFVREDSIDNFVLRSKTIELNLQQISPGLQAAFRVLEDEGATEEQLSNIVLETDGGSTLPQLYYYLQQFTHLGLICHTVWVDGVSLATCIPLATPYNFQFSEVALEQKYVLSRFAYCHAQNSQVIWETPLFPAQILVADWRGAALLAELAKPQNCHNLTKIPGIALDTAGIVLSLLLSATILSQVDRAENEALAQWEFHDLLFHSRSRVGRHNNIVGKSYRFLGKIEPPPALKPKLSSETIELYKPNLEELELTDASFAKILEQRKSLNTQGEKPISDRQLGEFLYRCARVREIFSNKYMQCTKRSYPSAGACYELELYIAINTCTNIASGLYHYCPQEHQLEKISQRNNQIESLLQDARNACGQKDAPQILIILAARFARVSWAYESIAYSLILKDVGALYQNMYLVATAMNLAACALGKGNSDLFAAATGCDYYTESSVGEFILGSNR